MKREPTVIFLKPYHKHILQTKTDNTKDKEHAICTWTLNKILFTEDKIIITPERYPALILNILNYRDKNENISPLSQWISIKIMKKEKKKR